MSCLQAGIAALASSATKEEESRRSRERCQSGNGSSDWKIGLVSQKHAGCRFASATGCLHLPAVHCSPVTLTSYSYIINYPRKSQDGFTLVEIMIVVAIIAMLSTLAIPVWQKVRSHSICNTMDNDTRQLAGAAQQYFMEYGVTTVTVGYAAGAISGHLADRVRFVGQQYTDTSWTLTTTATFDLTHPSVGAPRIYDAEGHYQP
jgi:prepilin-type N-terminal cleavage/methylation domain-containing protein